MLRLATAKSDGILRTVLMRMPKGAGGGSQTQRRTCFGLDHQEVLPYYFGGRIVFTGESSPLSTFSFLRHFYDRIGYFTNEYIIAKIIHKRILRIILRFGANSSDLGGSRDGRLSTARAFSDQPGRLIKLTQLLEPSWHFLDLTSHRGHTLLDIIPAWTP